MWTAVTDVIATQMRETFGEPFTLQSRVGPPQSLRGIYEVLNKYDGLSAESSLMGEDATLTVRTQDLTFVPERDDFFTITRTGKRYKLIKPDFDGWAMHTFYLREFV